MTAAMAMPGNTADTFLVHFFDTGLADDRYVVERLKARADGDIVPVPAEALRRARGLPGCAAGFAPPPAIPVRPDRQAPFLRASDLGRARPCPDSAAARSPARGFSSRSAHRLSNRIDR